MKIFLYVCLLSLLIQSCFLIPIRASNDDIRLSDNEYDTTEEL